MWDWLHEKGYDATTIPDLTVIELNLAKLGHIVRGELETDAATAAGGGHSSLVDDMKRDHKRSIRQRLRRQ